MSAPSFGAQAGTPLFSAPEQLALSRYGTSADVWAAGCVFACLALDTPRPYAEAAGGGAAEGGAAEGGAAEADSPGGGLLGRIARGEVWPTVPKGAALHAVVAHCCRVEADARPSAASLVLDLNELSRGAPTEAKKFRPDVTV